MLYTVLLVFHVLIAVALVGLVLIQHGRGADAGAAFGSGASATVFGAGGSASFLTRTTGVLATLFFVTSLTLATLAGQEREAPKSVVEQGATQGETQKPKQPSKPGQEQPAAPTVPEDVPQIPDQR